MSSPFEAILDGAIAEIQNAQKLLQLRHPNYQSAISRADILLDVAPEVIARTQNSTFPAPGVILAFPPDLVEMSWRGEQLADPAVRQVFVSQLDVPPVEQWTVELLHGARTRVITPAIGGGRLRYRIWAQRIITPAQSFV